MIWPAAVIGFLSNYMITPRCSCPAIVVRLSPACKLRFTLHLSLSPLQSQRHWAALPWLEVSLHAAGHWSWSVLIISCSRPRLWPQAGQQAHCSVQVSGVRYSHMTGLLHEGIFHVGGLIKLAIFGSLLWAYVICNWAQILICLRH